MIKASDHTIWHYAKAGGYCIISKDSDYYQLSILHGCPPKVIWLRVGNCSTTRIEQLLEQHRAAILHFGIDPIQSILILG